MKLIHCPNCKDLFRLTQKDRACECGASGGHYGPDGRNAIIWADAIPFGLDNFEFYRAIQRRPEAGLGRAISFWIMPQKNSHIEVANRDAMWYWERYQQTGRYEDMTTWLKHRAWENGWTPIRVSRFDPVLDQPCLDEDPCLYPAEGSVRNIRYYGGPIVKEEGF